MHSLRLCVVGLPVLVLSAAVIRSAELPTPFPQTGQQEIQQQAAPASSSAPAQQSSSSTLNAEDSSSKGKKSKHAHDFLIRGTVFQPSGLAFPGIKLRIRRESEKKFRWQTLTNSRGEFAVRVPQGLQYVLSVEAKGLAEQSRQVDARGGLSEENVSLRLEPAEGGKKK